MSALRQTVRDYLTLRRALGYKLEDYGSPLLEFVATLERSGDPRITTAAALNWACLSSNASTKTRAGRLSMVRGFAKHVHALDPRTEVPPKKLLPCPKQRPTPRLYKQEEIPALMNAARELAGELRPDTYATVIGLLAVTGMRLGEAINLGRSDLNEREALLVIRDSKFGKSREIPLHQTTVAALQAYAAKRDRVIRRPRSPSYFLSQAGTRVVKQNFQFCFPRLLRRVGLPDQAKHRLRVHELRHTFAVQTLIDWYRSGADPEKLLPILSTYLGHVNPSNTYWYLTAVPELVVLIAERLQKHLGGAR
ncbi:MAG: tyrosine-type recombinase/integrase [Elusimicrobia bacterium]|nr:tyrosine-type recombinase/integrase [Elusimicrobiota bacterium]